MKRIYYAHSVQIYDTPQEKAELDLLRELIPKCEIVNPNGQITEMWEAYDLLDTCHALVATEHLEHIGKGVYSEISHALGGGKRVGLLRDGKFHTIRSPYQLERVDSDDWHFYYAKIALGFSLERLFAQMKLEEKQVGELHPRCDILDSISSDLRDYLIHLGRYQMLQEIVGVSEKERR